MHRFSCTHLDDTSCKMKVYSDADLPTLLLNFAYYLRGCSFIVNGELELVAEDEMVISKEEFKRLRDIEYPDSIESRANGKEQLEYLQERCEGMCDETCEEEEEDDKIFVNRKDYQRLLNCWERQNFSEDIQGLFEKDTDLADIESRLDELEHHCREKGLIE